MTTTNNVTDAIIHYLRAIGGIAWRNNVGGFAGEYTDRQGNTRRRFVSFGEKGQGDVLALMRDGTFVSVEVKTGRDKLRPEQVAWMDDVNARGGVAFVANSVDDVIAKVR